MKISKRKIKSLIAEAMQKTILKEVKANNWDEYVNVGKTEAAKQERRKLWMMWELWTKADSPASYVLMDAPNIPVNPTQYTGGYDGWVEWYKDMVKNKEAMSSMGRTKNFNVADHFKYVEKYFPKEAMLPTMKIAKMKADQQVVDNFMTSLTALDNQPQVASLDFLNKKLETNSKTLVATIKDAAQKYKIDANSIDNNKVDNAVKELSNGDAMGRLAATREVEKVLDPKLASEFLELIDLSKPSKAELKKSKKYQSALNDTEKSELAKGLSDESESGVAGEDKKKSNESKMMNENRIRAIIRHELIQSMKK